MSDTTPPALPATAPPPTKASMVRRLSLGCVGLILLSCVGMTGVYFYGAWQQERNYQAGQQAYLAADCATAAEPLGKAARGEPGDADSDVARKAQAHLQECESLLAADTLASQNKPGEAVLMHSAFITKHPTSPLRSVSLEKGKALVMGSKPTDLATENLCQSLDTLTTQQLVVPPGDPVPAILLACGQNYEAARKFGDALLFYNRVRREYPNHGLSQEARTAFARATIAEAQAMGAGALPAPQAKSGGGTATQVTVVIRNDSPEHMSIVFSGPEVRVEELEACSGCAAFTGAAPSACPGKGPVGQYVLAPGSYDVVVKASSGRNVTPFRGTWTLQSNQEYSSCFYLVRG